MTWTRDILSEACWVGYIENRILKYNILNGDVFQW
jgi:hypothetical protein